MPKENQSTLALNRGILSPLGMARVDLARYRMAAERMNNWICRTLGSMMLRPGLGYIGRTKGNAYARTMAFIFSATDLARIEVTAAALRVWINDALVTRPAVTATVTNGLFNANIAGWTDSDEAGGVSSWATGGYASLVGNGTNNAILDQQITVNEASIEHALRIIIKRGPVLLRVGSTQGDDNYITETTLGTGTHSLTLTPTGNFWIRLMNNRINASLVDSVAIEAAGTLELPVPWIASDLQFLRWKESADVMYVACRGYQQRKIERRSLRSWSIVLYEPEKGPFRVLNITPTTLAPSALTGDITVVASKALFKSTHVGALFRITSVGQTVTAAIAGADLYTDPIRVNGVGDQRIFHISVTGVFVGTVTLQSSVAAPGSWVDVESYTVPTTKDYDDTFDNEVIYYRLGIKPAGYTSGTATCTLSFPSGSITGIVRVTAFTDSTHVSAAVLKALGATTASGDWYEGAWSDRRGWPSTVALHEGRLCWFGSTIYGSVSDDYENFDDTVIGDSGPFARSIGEGPVNNISWAISVQRLLMGTASGEYAVRSSSLDEPLTPTNFNIKPTSTQGAADIDAVRMDKMCIFAQVSGQRVFQLDIDFSVYDYAANDLTLLVPDLLEAGIIQIAIQRKPDTRLHCLLADGTAGILVFDKAENVIAWQTVDTDGVIEDISVLPGVKEDAVYYLVQRTVNGSTVRNHERWALESECKGLPIAKFADAHILYSGVATTTITGLSTLEGESVVVWGWNTVNPFIDGFGNTTGRDLGTFTVTGGQITGLAHAVTNACVGLPYTAQWKSMKQAFAAALGTPLNQAKRIDRLGLILRNTHALGVAMGPDFEHLDDIPYDDLPRIAADDTVVDVDAMHVDYDHPMTAFNDIWSTDSRVCLQAAAPRPASVLAFTVSMNTSG